MKIAVLFGSFNPITNAHVTALKTAVAQLGAEKGLLVATNGEYLRRKTVKINDPFYLTEEERKETIEKICENESRLSFACFEVKIEKPYSALEITKPYASTNKPSIGISLQMPIASMK